MWSLEQVQLYYLHSTNKFKKNSTRRFLVTRHYVKKRYINLVLLTYFTEILLPMASHTGVSIFVALGRYSSPLDYTLNYQASVQSGNQAHWNRVVQKGYSCQYRGLTRTPGTHTFMVFPWTSHRAGVIYLGRTQVTSIGSRIGVLWNPLHCNNCDWMWWPGILSAGGGVNSYQVHLVRLVNF